MKFILRILSGAMGSVVVLVPCQLFSLCKLSDINVSLKITKFHDFSCKLSECQTIWISDEAPRFVGPHLDPNCLHIELQQLAGKTLILQHFCDAYWVTNIWTELKVANSLNHSKTVVFLNITPGSVLQIKVYCRNCISRTTLI